METPSAARCTWPDSDQLVHDRAGQVDRNGEAVAGVEPGLAGDRRVDADDLAADAHQRAAGVARIDGGVGLDEVLDAALAPARQPVSARPLALTMPEVTVKVSPSPSGLPMASTHSPTRASSLLPSATGGSSVASILSTATSVLGSVPIDLGLELPPVEQPHGHLLGALDDVVVGQDVAVGRDDEPRAAALLDLGLLAEPGEEPLHARRHPLLLGGALGPLGADVDHARLDVLRHRREGLAQVLERPGRRDRRRRHLGDAPRRAPAPERTSGSAGRAARRTAAPARTPGPPDPPNLSQFNDRADIERSFSGNVGVRVLPSGYLNSTTTPGDVFRRARIMARPALAWRAPSPQRVCSNPMPETPKEGCRSPFPGRPAGGAGGAPEPRDAPGARLGRGASG